ncbi:MAG: MFS transporter, partial [Ignavibacteriaceae bacterium]
MKSKSALSLIFLTVFVDLLGFGILIPILPSFAKLELLVDEAAIGIVIAVYSFVQFLFNPILGRLSDRYGRKPVIVISLLINAIGYIIFAFTTSYLILLVSRIVAGIGGSSIAVAQAYIADVTTKENRTKGMGIIGSAFGLGFVFGPLIGGFLSSYGYMITGFGSASFSILAFVLTLLLLPESNLNREVATGRERKLFDFNAVRKVFA